MNTYIYKNVNTKKCLCVCVASNILLADALVEKQNLKPKSLSCQVNPQFDEQYCEERKKISVA